MSYRETSVIFGATSALAIDVARLLNERNHDFILFGRNHERLELIASDLIARGSSVNIQVCDLNNTECVQTALDTIEHFDNCFLFQAVLTDQERSHSDVSYLKSQLSSNFTNPVLVLSMVADKMEYQKHGKIVVIGSVAGDRGRQSNYTYGASKGGLALFSEGLRVRMYKLGIDVVIVKPGFIDTPMTSGIEKKPAILWSTTENVAKDIVDAMHRRKCVVYSPWFWRPIMLLIKLIPDFLFKKTTI